ncbi:MAG: DUF4167 domain-containing protein [Pseudomonadota bacterium]
MINNNRQAGRRRGRGGQRQGGGNPNNGNGNRIDNRARGNAAQLLEKYKTLAADAQRQGDRVNAEYYLQFADHYFRVLAETRSRFEEQNPNQSQRNARDDGYGDEGDEQFDDDGNEIVANDTDNEPRRQPQQAREVNNREDRGNRDNGNRDNGNRDGGNREYGNRDSGNRDDRGNQPRAAREPREDRPAREPREDRGNRANGNAPANGNSFAANDGDGYIAPAAEQPSDAPRRGRPRREARPVEVPVAETFDAALLPPSLGISASVSNDEEAPAKPRRPRRRPAAEAADAAE